MKTASETQSRQLVLHPSDTALFERIAMQQPHATLVYGGITGSHVEAAVSLGSQMADTTPTNHILDFHDHELTIDAAREIRNNLRVAGSKVVITPPLESASNEAQNALLKVLEEPSEGTHFVVAAVNHDVTLSTIESRCRVVELQRPRNEDFYAAYPEHDSSEIDKALIASRGAYSAFTAYLSGDRSEHELAKQFVSADPSQRMSLVSQSTPDREAAIRLVSYIQSIYVYLLENQPSAAGKHAARIDLCSSALSKLRANGNVKLLLDELCISL